MTTLEKISDLLADRDQQLSAFNFICSSFIWAQVFVSLLGTSMMTSQHCVFSGDYSPEAINEVFEWPQYSGNEGCSEPRVINANHIRNLNRDVKIIIIMRHPVQRLERSSVRSYGPCA